MGVKEKIAYAEPSSWLTENMTEEQVEEIMAKAKEKARKQIAICDALDSLRDFMYSSYQKDLSIVMDYIEELEKEIEDLKEAKAIYVERPKTMQEKQAESEKYEKAFDDGYENGYAQARFDYDQQPCDDCVSRESVKKLKKYRLSYDTNTTIPKTDIFVKIADIAGLPSVTPQRPKGKWIPIHPLQEDDDGAYMCSNCEHGDWDCDTSYKYCPFCGAKMRGDEDEND